MKSADMREVFQRLAEEQVPFLDERHQEMPHEEKHPLFLLKDAQVSTPSVD